MEKVVIGNCTLYHADCMDVIPLLGKVDAVVTDPPYGIKYKSPSGKGKTFRGNYDVIEGDDKEFDPSPFLGFDDVIMWGANHYANKLPNSAKWITWDKRCGMAPNNNSDCEMAWCKNGGSARHISHLWNGMLKDSERSDQRQHPTQKPIAVMEFCLKQLPDSKVIYDPYMGSGTTGVACIKVGKSFIGVEMDKKYFDIACQRIRDAYSQPDMFL